MCIKIYGGQKGELLWAGFARVLENLEAPRKNFILTISSTMRSIKQQCHFFTSTALNFNLVTLYFLEFKLTWSYVH